MNSEQIISVFQKIAERINIESAFLTELDNVIGDGDHGINLNRGFETLLPKLEGLKESNPFTIFKTVGMTLVSTVGGASGPLYGTMFLNMAKAIGDKETVSVEDFLLILQSGIDGVMFRGKSVYGEKTCLIP